MIVRIYLAVTLLLCTQEAFSEITGKVAIEDNKGKKVGSCSNAIAFIEGDSLKAISTKKDARMSLKELQFSPRILPIQMGTTVEFPNEDVILHNVFSFSKSNKFDLGLYRKSEGKSVEFKKTGLVKVFCNIHGNMSGHILVLENPHFARVNEDCTFKIPSPPDGDYNLSVWYLMGKGDSTTIKVSGGKANSVNMTLKHRRNKLPKHKNKDGKSYKKSY